MRSGLTICLVAVLAANTGCSNSAPSTEAVRPYVLPEVLTLNAHTSRSIDGGVVISGTTNLPDGLKMWVEVEKGRLPRGAPNVVASDNDVVVKDGKFASSPLWLTVPNTRFTRKGWPKGVSVNDRLKPFPENELTVHFESMFNRAWQTPQVITALGGEDGKKLKGPILKATDADIIDSPMVVDYLLTLAIPPISLEAEAISLVKSSILTLPDKGRSAGDIQANLDLYLSYPGLHAGKGWTAKVMSPNDYEVSYDFIDGDNGEQQALWVANLTTGKVKYENENGKIFSWTPAY